MRSGRVACTWSPTLASIPETPPPAAGQGSGGGGGDGAGCGSFSPWRILTRAGAADARAGQRARGKKKTPPQFAKARLHTLFLTLTA
jgi:hypothetical protein